MPTTLCTPLDDECSICGRPAAKGCGHCGKAYCDDCFEDEEAVWGIQTSTLDTPTPLTLFCSACGDQEWLKKDSE